MSSQTIHSDYSHSDYSHSDRTLWDCPACQRPCQADCPDRQTSCVGEHPAQPSRTGSQP